MSADKATVKAVIQATLAVAEAIRELGQVPSGELYVRLSSVMTLQDYQAIVDTLKRAGVVKEVNYLLTWVPQEAV